MLTYTTREQRAAEKNAAVDAYRAGVHGPPAPPKPHPCDLYEVLLFPSTAHKPIYFIDREALARHLVRECGWEEGLDCVNVAVGLVGSIDTRVMASVWTYAYGARGRFLGFVWLGERDNPRALLTEAVRAVTQPRVRQ